MDAKQFNINGTSILLKDEAARNRLTAVEGKIPSDASSENKLITKTVNDLLNYYLKSETYTKAEVEALIGAIQHFHYEVYASTSAVTTPASNVLYLIGPTGSGADKYEEYVYSNNTWVKIGDTSIDLSGYVTTEALNTALAAYTTTANLTTLLAGKQDVISDLATIRSGAAAGATAYQKPSGGIPKTDLASGVQDSLDLADESLQYTLSGQVDPSVTPGSYVTRSDIVDNLTTDDATKILSAKQGKVLGDAVSQLGQKWKEGPDTEITGFITGAYSTNGNYSTSVLAKAGAKGKNLDVLPGQKYRIYATSDASTWYRCCAVFKADGTKILTAPAGDYTVNPFEVTIPSDGAKMTINLINYNSATDGAFLITEETDAAAIVEMVNSVDEKTEASIQQLIFEQRVRQKASNRYSSIMADWMQVVNMQSGMTSKDVLSVVSSTENSIILSSTDAAYFTNESNPCIVRWNDGTTKLVYFDKASGTSVPRMDFDTTDLTDAVQVQSIHDTVRGGAGIHLSQLGYIYLGQWTAAEVARKIAQRDSNLLAGVQFYNSTESADKKTITTAGLPVVYVDSNMDSTGSTEGAHLATYGIETNSLNTQSCGYLYTAYRFVQSKGHDITFRVPVCGMGWVEIVAGQSIYYPTSTGKIKMDVYVDGALLSSMYVAKKITRYIFEGVIAKNNISVKFSTEVSDCEGMIYEINFYSMSDVIPVVSLSGKKVAVLGDSWTQFPGINDGLQEYSAFNELVVHPDGTNGEGFGYFPKEFARVSGAVVDNWGKSNMRADNWGLVKIDEILAHTDYDYLLIEFFINDQNAGIGYDDWAANIAKIAEKCRRAGVRPIIVCPCLTNGDTKNPFGIRHEMVVRGLGTF